MLEGIVIESKSFSGEKSLDYALALSDENFAKFHSELMSEYRDSEGWWSESKPTPKCDECHEIISGPEELRRYEGRTMHPECFKKFYEKKIKAFYLKKKKSIGKELLI